MPSNSALDIIINLLWSTSIIYGNALNLIVKGLGNVVAANLINGITGFATAILVYITYRQSKHTEGELKITQEQMKLTEAGLKLSQQQMNLSLRPYITSKEELHFNVLDTYTFEDKQKQYFNWG